MLFVGRLAVVGIATALVSSCSTGTIEWQNASGAVGEHATVCGPLVSTHQVTESWGDATFINLGRDYPHANRFTIVVWERVDGIDDFLDAGDEVCGSGTVSLYEGALQMELTSFKGVNIPGLEQDIPEPDYPGPY